MSGHFDKKRTLRTLDSDVALLAQKLGSYGRFERSQFIATPESRRTAQAEIQALAHRVGALTDDCPITSILLGHFTDFLDGMKANMEHSEKNPGAGFPMLTSKLYSLCCNDFRHDEVRAGVLDAKLAALPTLWNDSVLPALDGLAPEKLQNCLMGLTRAAKAVGYVLPKVEGAFKSFPKSQTDAIFANMQKYQENLQAYTAHVGRLVEESGGVSDKMARGEDETLPITQDEYRDALKNRVGVCLDELLGWHEHENAKTRIEALELANKLGHPVRSTAEVSEVLFKHAGPCKSPDEMFQRVDSYLKRARAAARDYIWLPEDELCECVPVPEMYKDSYPWGGYSGDQPLSYPLYNTMFLNNHNYKAITDGWIKLNALHEAYPGHHAQFVRATTDPIPETLKRGAKTIPFSEGVCMRTERVFEFVFAEDPYYPLMVAHRRHHTSTRIKIDLWLHYFGKTIGEVCDLYECEMGFDRKTARAQVQAHENGTGYFTGYYYGLKKLTDWEAFYGWDRRDYTELLFSVGRPSLDTFEKILRLGLEDRDSLLHSYASLLQFP